MDLMEAPSSSSSRSWGQSKRKRNQVITPDGVINVNGNESLGGVLISVNNKSDDKNKQPLEYAKDWQKHANGAFSGDLPSRSAYDGSEDDIMLDASKCSDPDLVAFNCSDEYEDEMKYDEDEDDEDFGYDIDVVDSCNYNLAARFDDLDLPPGVEATVPWLQKPIEKLNRSKQEKTEDDIDKIFRSFKRFDTVNDCSDHYFAKPETVVGSSAIKKPPKEWVKRIQNEWKLLENDLPDTIFVRAYEDRMDLLRACIMGPAGTPYHDGLFFFDMCFPPNYPQSPPMAKYHSGGLHINPNLYACGKVCLSLLNTWPGSGCENWSPSTSTMLQVLVSIQALVLNANPYFNEPGYERFANTPHGDKLSTSYNEETFLHSCKTMLYTLRRPPKHFEDLVSGHFRHRGHAILAACRAYIGGAKVGCHISEAQNDVPLDKTCSSPFKLSVKKFFEELLMEFAVKGAGVEEFLQQKVKTGVAKAVDTSLKA